MPFPFTHLVDLLEPLYELATKTPLPKPIVLRTKSASIISSWFDYHRTLFASTELDPIALFSLLFPELRCDRVYGFKEDGLSKIVARCLGLGVTRQKQLSNWRREADGDLGEMVGRVMKQAENPPSVPGQEVTVEEIDGVLEILAGRSIFSSQSKLMVRHHYHDSTAKPAHELLGPIYLRLGSIEGKWLTRAILKSYLPMVIPEKVTMYSYHFLLPHLFAFQNDLRRALRLLETPLYRIFPAKPENKDVSALLEGAMKLVKPEVGVRIRRVGFLKARSCKNAAILAKGGRMSMERKYDGEYCQIHIDLSRGNSDWIRIFSKSGRDSTNDRQGVHKMIREALRIDKPSERGFKKHCILEGELAVYCEKEQLILEFYHLRSHVNRSGIFLGNKADERPDYANQHLMIIFYDLLLLDTHPYLAYSYDRRRSTLEHIIHPHPGRAELAERYEVDFSTPFALENLREKFAQGITKRYEGYVLKPCEAPYLGFGVRDVEWIKLKKDYIKGLGDTADFAIVGGGYEPERGKVRGVGGEGLTTFFVGVLMNKEGVVRFGARPVFKVVFHVSYNIVKQDLEYLNKLAYFRAQKFEPAEYDLHLPPNLPPIDVYFTTPLVFELTGGGFDRPPDTDYYILRWPRVLKIPWDRDWKEAIGFDELQEMAEMAVKEPRGTMEEDVEERRWVRRLEEEDMGRRRKREEVGEDATRGEERGEGRREGCERRVIKRRMTEPAMLVGQEVLEERRRMIRRYASEEGTSQRSLAESLDYPTPSPDIPLVPPESPPQTRDQVPVLPPSPSSLPSSSSKCQPEEHTPHPDPYNNQPPLSLSNPQPLLQQSEPSINTTSLSPSSRPRSKTSPHPRPPLHPISSTSVTNINSLLDSPRSPPLAAPSPSPLTSATIFLIPSVQTQSLLSPCLSHHNPSSIHPVSHFASFISSYAAQDIPDKVILLVDTRTPRTSKRYIAEMLVTRDAAASASRDAGVSGVGVGVGIVDADREEREEKPEIHVYDWRVVGHSDRHGRERLDLLDVDKENQRAKDGKEDEGMRKVGKGLGRRRRGRKVDWDLFYMLTV